MLLEEEIYVFSKIHEGDTFINKFFKTLGGGGCAPLSLMWPAPGPKSRRSQCGRVHRQFNEIEGGVCMMAAPQIDDTEQVDGVEWSALLKPNLKEWKQVVNEETTSL